MVMDVVGYMFLLKEGGDRLPPRMSPIFVDYEAIKTRESEIMTGPAPQCLSTVNPGNHKYWIRFEDKDFRQFTSLSLSSNEILRLLLETSRVEFKLVYPIRIMDGRKGLRERWYTLNFFSRPFELGYVDRWIRKDSIVRGRQYLVVFNTILGELFVNNLKTHNFDWLDAGFYKLPPNAQIFYRRFVLNNDYLRIPINLDTIKRSLNLSDQNITNLKNTVEDNILEPLQKAGYILSYQTTMGLHDTKYIISRSPKTSYEKDCG
jgi:hypothetical protein